MDIQYIKLEVSVYVSVLQKNIQSMHDHSIHGMGMTSFACVQSCRACYLAKGTFQRPPIVAGLHNGIMYKCWSETEGTAVHLRLQLQVHRYN